MDSCSVPCNHFTWLSKCWQANAAQFLPSLPFPLFLYVSTTSTEDFSFLSLSADSCSYRSFPLSLPPSHPVSGLFCLFSPNPPVPLIHLLPDLPFFAASFVPSPLITSCVAPFFLIRSQQETVASRFILLTAQWELGLLASGLFWRSPCS